MLFVLTGHRVKGAQSTLFVRRRHSRQSLHGWNDDGSLQNCSFDNLHEIPVRSVGFKWKWSRCHPPLTSKAPLRINFDIKARFCSMGTVLLAVQHEIPINCLMSTEVPISWTLNLTNKQITFRSHPLSCSHKRILGTTEFLVRWKTEISRKTIVECWVMHTRESWIMKLKEISSVDDIFTSIPTRLHGKLVWRLLRLIKWR